MFEIVWTTTATDNNSGYKIVGGIEAADQRVGEEKHNRQITMSIQSCCDVGFYRSNGQGCARDMANADDKPVYFPLNFHTAKHKT